MSGTVCWVFRGAELRALVGDVETAELLVSRVARAWRLERPAIARVESDLPPNVKGERFEWLVWELPLGATVRCGLGVLEACWGGGNGLH